MGRMTVSRVGQICRVRRHWAVRSRLPLPRPFARYGLVLIPSDPVSRMTWVASAAWSTSGPHF